MNDKLMHFLMGVSISLFFGLLVSSMVGLIFACIGGAAKELIWDKWLKKGTPELMDFIATASGGFLVMLILKYLGGL